MLGDVVRAQRLARQWRQTDLARRAGIAQSLVCQIERKAVPRPSAAVWQGLARAFDLTVADLRQAAGLTPIPPAPESGAAGPALDAERPGRRGPS